MPARTTLTVIVEASSQAEVETLIDQLARSACDVSNSSEDADAHIVIFDPAP